MYSWSGAAWEQRGNDIGIVSTSSGFGFDVGLSEDGNIVASSAPGTTGAGFPGGAAAVFTWDEDSWWQLGSTIVGEQPLGFLGFILGLGALGSELVLASVLEVNGDSVCVAYVYVFDAGSDDWVVRGAPLTGLPAADVFDVGVAISSNADVVVVGSSGSSSGLGEGSISVYTWVPGNSQYEELRDPLVGVLGEGFGGYRSLALSGSGLILAAAVTGRGANGPLSGGVRVFRSYRQGWVPMGSIIEGAAAGDLAGSSVGLSENGQVLLVASRGSDSNTGSLAVYVWTSGDWEQRGDVHPVTLSGGGFGDVRGS